QGRTTPTRIDMARRAVMAGCRFHHANAAAIAADLATGRDLARAAGAAGAAFTLSGESGTLTLNPAPKAYRLTLTQYNATEVQREAFGIEAQPAAAGGWVVPMAQDAYPLIPFVLDPDSEYATVHAERLAEPPPAPAPVP